MTGPPPGWDWRRAYEDDLTTKKRSIIDSWVELKQDCERVTHSAVARNAANHHPEGEEANGSYVGSVLRKPDQRAIAEEKLQHELGEPPLSEEEGVQRGEGLPPTDIRVNQDGERYFMAPITEEEALTLLRGEKVPRGLAERLFNAVWDGYFDNL